MPIVVQKVSDLGATSKVVARCMVQSFDLLRAFAVDGAVRSELEQNTETLQKALITCHKRVDNVRDEIGRVRSEVATQGLVIRAGGQLVDLPSIVDLEGSATTFLQTAKVCLALSGRQLTPFFKKTFEHKLSEVATWAETTYDRDHLLAVVARRHEPTTKRIVDMRNAIDHPNDGRNRRLVINNFTLNGSLEIAEPAWGLSDGPLEPIGMSMETYLEHVVQVAEELLVAALLTTSPKPIEVRDLPERLRNPECPVRFVAVPAR